MNASGACQLIGGSGPSGEDAFSRRFTAVKAFAAALFAGVALVAGGPAGAASFPVFSLSGGTQIADPAPYSVSSDSLNYVAKTVTIKNEGTNNINRVRLVISASTKVPVKDYSACVSPCTSVSTTSLRSNISSTSFRPVPLSMSSSVSLRRSPTVRRRCPR